MGGLALGGFLGGRLCARISNPLRIYGLLALGLAIFSVTVPWFIEFVSTWSIWSGQFQDSRSTSTSFLLASGGAYILIFLVPTTLMGAMFPVLSAYFTRSLESVGWDFGRLYAVFSLGAALGVLFTGIFGIRSMGLMGCLLAAVLIDLLIALLALFLAWRDGIPQSKVSKVSPRGGSETPENWAVGGDFDTVKPPLPSRPRSNLWVPMPVLVFSGFASMILQISWARTVAESLGNSTYAHTIPLFVFMLGIGLGGAIMARCADLVRNIPLVLGMLLMASTIVILGTNYGLGLFPVWGTVELLKVEPSFNQWILTQFRIVAILLLPATLLMGMAFPLFGKWVTTNLNEVGRSIGQAYFAINVGSTLGVLAVGLLFIPIFEEVYVSLYIACGISLFSGIWLCLLNGSSLKMKGSVIGALTLLILIGVFQSRPYGVLGSENKSWHPAIQSFGLSPENVEQLSAPIMGDKALGFEEVSGYLIEVHPVVYFKQGIHQSVALVQDLIHQKFTLRIAGNPESSATQDTLSTNELFHASIAAHLPMLHHPSPREVLTIGLSTGQTLGALTLYNQHPKSTESGPNRPEPTDSSLGNNTGIYTVHGIDFLELSREVLEVADSFFSKTNHHAVNNPRVHHVLAEGRNYLNHTSRRYDVITSLASRSWNAGVGNLYTEEFFRAVRGRLNPGGLFCQWIHIQRMRPQDFKMVLRTIQPVFPEHLQLWNFGTDSILLARKDAPIQLDLSRVASALEDEKIAKELAILGVVEPTQLLRFLKFTSRDLRSFVGEGPTHQDLYPFVEFMAAMGLHGDVLDAVRNLGAQPSTHFKDDREFFWQETTDLDLKKISHHRKVFQTYEKLYLVFKSEATPDKEQMKSFLLEIADSGDPWVMEMAAEIVFTSINFKVFYPLSEKFLKINRQEMARTFLERGVKTYPQHFNSLQLLGAIWTQKQDFEAAQWYFDQAVSAAKNPTQKTKIYNDRGFFHETRGDLQGARRDYEEALSIDSNYQIARNNLERVWVKLGKEK